MLALAQNVSNPWGHTKRVLRVLQDRTFAALTPILPSQTLNYIDISTNPVTSLISVALSPISCRAATTGFISASTLKRRACASGNVKIRFVLTSHEGTDMQGNLGMDALARYSRRPSTNRCQSVEVMSLSTINHPLSHLQGVRLLARPFLTSVVDILPLTEQFIRLTRPRQDTPQQVRYAFDRIDTFILSFSITWHPGKLCAPVLPSPNPRFLTVSYYDVGFQYWGI